MWVVEWKHCARGYRIGITLEWSARNPESQWVHKVFNIPSDFWSFWLQKVSGITSQFIFLFLISCDLSEILTHLVIEIKNGIHLFFIFYSALCLCFYHFGFFIDVRTLSLLSISGSFSFPPRLDVRYIINYMYIPRTAEEEERMLSHSDFIARESSSKGELFVFFFLHPLSRLLYSTFPQYQFRKLGTLTRRE